MSDLKEIIKLLLPEKKPEGFRRGNTVICESLEMSFPDIDGFRKEELVLPIVGKEYTVRSCELFSNNHWYVKLEEIQNEKHPHPKYAKPVEMSFPATLFSYVTSKKK